MELIVPCGTHLPEYVEALRKGWSPDNLRPEASQEQLDAIAADPESFLSRFEDRNGSGGRVTLPDGTRVPRLPGIVRWIWDDGFCGSIGLRWQPGTEELPPYCLGHVGYAVVPWRRGRGLASAALVALLPEARAVGLRYVEVTVSPDNTASTRVIRKAGGVFHERFRKGPEYGEEAADRYRIYLDRHE